MILLVEGDQTVASFEVLASATFTTKRLIVRGAQGLAVTKVEVYSLPCNSIDMWPRTLKVRLTTGGDIRRSDSLLASAILNKD
jgi:hypothetical protein